MARCSNVPPRRRNVNTSTAPTIQRSSASPGIPLSAATVTGVLCDAAFFGSFPLRRVSSPYECLNPPTPTPNTGFCLAILIPFETSPARPLVEASRPEPEFFNSALRTCGLATLTARKTTATTAIAIAARRCQMTAATMSTATIKPPKLDCEYEKKRPIQHTLAKSKPRSVRPLEVKWAESM